MSNNVHLIASAKNENLSDKLRASFVTDKNECGAIFPLFYLLAGIITGSIMLIGYLQNSNNHKPC